MEFSEALRLRRMVRHYTGAPVPAETVRRIARAGLRAPTAGGTRGVSVITVTDAERIAVVADACDEADWIARGQQPWLSTSGAVLALCLEPDAYQQRYGQPDKDPAVLDAVPWWWVDGGAALMGILLAAVDEGLAAGFIGAHRTTAVRPILGIPDSVILLGLIALGHEAPTSRPPRRRTPGAVHEESW